MDKRKDLFTSGEAAEICRISQQTIIRCFDSGRLEGFRVPGSRLRRIPRQSLIRFMKENNIPIDNVDNIEPGRMKEVLSLPEIKQRYDGEWVLIADPETNDDFSIKEGVVLWHSKDRDEVYRKARELHPNHSAILCIAKLADDVAVVL